jgi:hypothetical protein
VHRCLCCRRCGFLFRRFDFWFMLTLISLLFIVFLCFIRVEKSRHIHLNIWIVSLCWRLQFMCCLYLELLDPLLPLCSIAADAASQH